jgi:trans-2,3-dihydro-3-hydroxyanthranilate isomerase
MNHHPYRIVNVFAESPLGGNPLCVFEDGHALDDATMQALALQFNLSETTFILPSAKATARVRIFTPTFEMPFAGHPTLGTAHVVRALGGVGDVVRLEMRAGIIPVVAAGDVWTLSANAPRHRPVSASRAELAPCAALHHAPNCCSPTATTASARWRMCSRRTRGAKPSMARNHSSRASSFPSTASSPRIRAPGPPARISAAGWSPPRSRCRNAWPSRKATTLADLPAWDSR